jgi:hypothetical protein
MSTSVDFSSRLTSLSSLMELSKQQQIITVTTYYIMEF